MVYGHIHEATGIRAITDHVEWLDLMKTWGPRMTFDRPPDRCRYCGAATIDSRGDCRHCGAPRGPHGLWP